nr:immunoglobulin light chain junction region [Mus musculus]
CLQYDEFPPTF